MTFVLIKGLPKTALDLATYRRLKIEQEAESTPILKFGTSLFNPFK